MKTLPQVIREAFVNTPNGGNILDAVLELIKKYNLDITVQEVQDELGMFYQDGTAD